MSSPRYTAEGVKVEHNGEGDFFCGHCGVYIGNFYGFPPTPCRKCGIVNRLCETEDMPSERLRELAKHLQIRAQKLMSTDLHELGVDLLYIAREVATLEEHERMFIGGPEPVRPEELLR